jgi:hypothetical protein
MCNAWNHPPGCTCGWGGEGHLGGGGGWSGDYTTPTIESFSYREGALTTYRFESDFCCPTNCPKCGAEVFFIRHNGGSVWVDPPLGWPWPKHGCFDDSSSTTGYRFIADLRDRYEEVDVKPKLGRVIKRIYQYSFHIYLIATHDGRLCALRAKRSERTVFTDLVSIRHTDDSIFLEDSRNKPVLVKNFKMTEETMHYYLTTPGEIFHVSKRRHERPPPPLVNVIWSIARQRFEPKR